VEDGHTLHLVARPLLPPAGTGPSAAGAEGLDSSLAHMYFPLFLFWTIPTIGT
jgi:hypothetical protein